MSFSLLLPLASALDNGAGLVPPMGWSTWCSGGHCGNDYCNETEVLQAANALISSGMAKLGWSWVVLDDCWAAMDRDSKGVITWDPDRFPSGIPAVVSKLHGLGLRFGLYTSVGNRTCNSGGRPRPIPGSKGHFVEDANAFARWGVDWVKADWCGEDDYLLGPILYREVSLAITHTIPKRTIFLNGVAAYPFLLQNTTDFMNSWRSWSDHKDDWEKTKATIQGQQDLGFIPGRPGAWPDMDILTTGGEGCTLYGSDHCPKQTEDEYETEVSIWMIYQSVLMVGTDIRNMTSVMKRLLLNAEVAAIHQDTRTAPGRHVGNAANCGTSALQCPLYARHMADGSVVAGLLNMDSKPHAVTIKYSSFDWQATDTANVRNIWTQESYGKFKGEFSTTVRPHQTVLIRLAKA